MTIITTSDVLPTFQEIREPELSFHPDRSGDVDINPLRGLTRFGPYSRSHNFRLRDPIRLAVICPSGAFTQVQAHLADLKSRHRPRERQQYLQDFDGFSKVFGIGVDWPVDSRDERVAEIPSDRLQGLLKQSDPQHSVAEMILAAVRHITSRRDSFDVLIIYLPDWLGDAFWSSPDDKESDFDLHDTIKAACASQSIPVQILNDKALKYPCRCSVAWRSSLAIYTKAGGVPWKLAGFESRHAYVGVSYCLRKGKNPQFVTCCSQIFDAEGTNLRFLLYESQNGQVEGENPYLSREDMRRVMSRTIDLYQRQKGAPPTRLVVHKSTHFQRDEVDGCIDALSAVDDLELLTLQDTAWQGIKIEAPRDRGNKGEPAAYPLQRGTVLPLGGIEYALWTQGNVSGIGSGSYFKEGKGIPHPVLVTRHLGTGGSHASAREILGLTKMNWNNDSLYDRAPVTLSYASILAGVVKRLGTLNNTPYDFRFFM